MSQVRNDILLNGMRLEIHPSKLTKCGEIHINDDCTDAFLFCAFCSDVDEHGLKFFKTLEEFIDHIRWHRSDDISCSEYPASPKNMKKCQYEIVDETQSNLSEPRHDEDDITDWIAPPEELFELNTISNLIEIEPQTESADVNYERKYKEIAEEVDGNVTSTKPDEPACSSFVEGEGDIPEITGEVLIELLDFMKKCPCLWHLETAANTNSGTIEGVYNLLTAHYNKCAQQMKSLEYVRGILTQIKDCFLEDYNDVDGSSESLPWYFPYLRFLLGSESPELDKSIFTDFLCPVCGQDLKSQTDLWEHISQIHLRSEKDEDKNDISMDDKDSTSESDAQIGRYPQSIMEKFIEIYRSQPRLWDKSNDEYYSRPLRQQSYDLLLKILQKHDSTSSKTDVLSQINRLRTKFAYDHHKALSSVNNSKNSKAHNWTYKKMQFLIGNMNYKSRHKPPPALKAKPSNFKKKVKNPKCPLCASNFTENSAWLSHMELAHTSSEYRSKDGFFYCKICGWQNKTKELLMQHLRNRHTDIMQRCTDCNLKFRLLSMLAEHRAKAHNDFSPFKCETCDEGFSTRSQLRKHSISHWSAEDLPHKCVLCGAKFSDRETCSAHVRSHNLEMKHRCEICLKEMASKADLRQHTRSHLSECPDVCDSCGKAFQNAQSLTDHLNEVHGGVTFPCDKCEKEFKSEKLLAAHYQGHEVQHHCEVCGMNFFRKTSLRKHQRLKHNYVAYDHIKCDYSL